jgi:tyrosyl-tRNA synthetase
LDVLRTLSERGLVYQLTDQEKLSEVLAGEGLAFYIGFDPTAPSLHIGNLVPLMTASWLQKAGHRPLMIVGGATALVGDPSGRSTERTLETRETVGGWAGAIASQLRRFLDFGPSGAHMLDNSSWLLGLDYIGFLRDIGSHFSVNRMLTADSVRTRLEKGLSFLEFNYMILQAYDFVELARRYDCALQMGGSDQWGNITTGTELIRRKTGGEAFALTCPLITKADGGKFGKTEKGNIWLDPEKTSPYAFYQFWLNCSDEDSKKYIRIFTLFSQDEITALELEHEQAPHLRALQKALARDLTLRVHGEAEFDQAVQASEILFGKGTTETLRQLDEKTLLGVFEGVPQSEISRTDLEAGIGMVDFLSEKTGIFPSKGEARRMLKDGGVQVNKEKALEDSIITSAYLLNNKYILAQKGKKNYFLVRVA